MKPRILNVVIAVELIVIALLLWYGYTHQ